MYAPQLEEALQTWLDNAETEQEIRQAEGNLELLENYRQSGLRDYIHLQIKIPY